MLYPQKLSSKKQNVITLSLLICSIIIALILILINHLSNSNVHWAALANAGIIYAWVTVIYSINKNINIAGHVLVQCIAISILTTYIDYKIGFSGWSLQYSIPIIIIIANITMFVLTIVSYRKYIRYAIYQLIICIFSMLPIYFIAKHMIDNNILSYVAIGISLLNFVLTVCLCAKDVKDAVVRKFHL